MASFTTQIKDEITKIETNRLESLSELCAYIMFTDRSNEEKISLFIENASVARRMFNLLKRLYGVNIRLTIRTQKKFKMKTILNYSDEERISFLKGAFLECGSINDPKKNKYHLEFLLDKEEYAKLINQLLIGFSFSSKILKRDKGYMVYIKASEEISDFIKMLGAINALFYYEDIRIYREHKNMVNRLNNCEQANDLLSLIDEKTQLVIDYRLKYPETTMNELAQIISLETDYKITKSGVNHHFRKIKELVTRHRDSKIKND